MKLIKPMMVMLGAALLGSVSPAKGEEKMNDPELDTAVDFTKYALTEESFRQAAAAAPSDAVKSFFAPAAALRWSMLVKDFSTEQLRDFFSGAMILRGAFNAEGAVCGMYNPWWDTVLLLESSGLPEVPKFKKFYFLSGETFRGEVSEVTDTTTVVPRSEPIAVVAAKKFLATQSKFEKLYEESGSVTLSDHGDSAEAKNMERIITRSALRLKMYSTLLHDERRSKQSRELAGVLKVGRERNFKQLFRTWQNAGIIRNFVNLDSQLRRGFIVYGYVPTAEGRQFLFINGEFPRLFATMSFSADLERAEFEWYDLATADKMLEIWASRKAKNGKEAK